VIHRVSINVPAAGEGVAGGRSLRRAGKESPKRCCKYPIGFGAAMSLNE
jgi:hypothetical protein